MREPSWYHVVAYTTVGVALVAGAGAIVATPHVATALDRPADDWMLRAAVGAFVGILGYQYLVMARDAWLRSHGVEPIAVELEARDVFAKGDPRREDD